MSKRLPSVYIVDDDISMGKSLKLLLASHDYKVEVFTSATDFLTFKHRSGPSCLLLDYQLPDINGLDLQQAMSAKKLAIPIIFITGHGNIPMSVTAMKAGAVDFLPKPFTPKELLDALALAITKNKTETIELAVIAKIKRRITTLSPREKEVFACVASGMQSKEIAYKLGTVLQTIKVHRSRVMQKMQAKSITELVQLAEKSGYNSSAN